MAIEYGEQVPRSATAARPALPKEHRRSHPKFLLMIHPHRWTWEPTVHTWLPTLGRLVVSAGVQGVGLDANGREDVSAAAAYYASEGWRVIEDGDPALAKVLPRGQYLARHPARPHGYAYSFVWEGVDRLGDAVEWGEDKAKRIEVQLHLATMLPPIPAKLIRDEVRTTRKRVQDLEEKLALTELPSVSLRLKRAKAVLEAQEREARRLGVVGADDLEGGFVGPQEPEVDEPEHLDAEEWVDPVAHLAAEEPARPTRGRKG